MIFLQPSRFIFDSRSECCRVPVRPLPRQSLHLVQEDRLVGPGIVNDVRSPLSPVPELCSPRVAENYSVTPKTCLTFLRGVMVVAFLEDLGIGHKSFVSRQDSQHSWNSSLKKPNKLVQIVQRDLEGFG